MLTYYHGFSLPEGIISVNLLPIEFSKYIQLIKFKMIHKVNLLLSEFSKTRGSPRNPYHG